MLIQILSYISLIILSIYFLIKAADYIEESFVYFAKKFEISEFFVGFIILATVSSLPEMAIAINSANKDVPELSVGNLLGAGVIMLTLVIGLSAVRFKNVHFKGRFRRTEMTLGVLAILLGVGVLVDRKLTPLEGVICLGVYILFLLHVQRRFREKKREEMVIRMSSKKITFLLTRALTGIVLLLISSTLAVEGVILLGEEAHINESLIGLFVLALGTNTPELTMLLRARNIDQTKLAIGNFLGSAIFNTATLGLLAILSGGFVITNFISLVPVMVLIVFASSLFLAFSWTGQELTIKEGYILVGAYLSLIIAQGIILVADL